MAKGLRASSKKANKSKLREKVFGPIEAARNERLSAKLIELASKPKVARDSDIDMDAPDKANDTAILSDGEMDLDLDSKPQPSSRRSSKSSKVQKRKKSSGIVFPVGRKEHKPKSETRKLRRKR